MYFLCKAPPSLLALGTLDTLHLGTTLNSEITTYTKNSVKNVAIYRPQKSMFIVGAETRRQDLGRECAQPAAPVRVTTKGPWVLTLGFQRSFSEWANVQTWNPQ